MKVVTRKVKLAVIIGGFLSVAGLVIAFAAQRSRDSAQQARPRRVSTSASQSSSSSSKLIRPGGNLQAALDAARPGDTITLEAGAKFTGPFVLRNKPGRGAETDWITIQSSQVSQLSAGVRVSPEKAFAMPTITVGSGQSAIKTNGAAHHYKFIGIEIVTNETGDAPYNLVELGDDGGGGQTTLDKVPHHFVFDRCYVHARDGQDAVRGFALNASDVEITNSYVSNFKSRRTDSQAIFAWNSPGRFKIVNNYLEAAAETVAFGGGGGCGPLAVMGIFPSDIELRRNTLTKRMEWKGVWLVKNLFEIKYGKRVIVDGNLMENNWADGQTGFAVQLTVRNDQGICNLTTIEDVSLTNNIIRRSSAGINIQGTDPPRASVPAKRITIRNNLLTDIDPGKYGGGYGFLQLVGEGSEIIVDHNTALVSRGSGGAISIQGQGTVFPKSQFTNNVVPMGIAGPGSPGNGSIAVGLPGSVIKNNIFYDDQVNEPEYGNYPADNWYPDTLNEVGLNIAGGNFNLANTSRYRGRGTDRKDPGCDIEALHDSMTMRVSTVPPRDSLGSVPGWTMRRRVKSHPLKYRRPGLDDLVEEKKAQLVSLGATPKPQNTLASGTNPRIGVPAD